MSSTWRRRRRLVRNWIIGFAGPWLLRLFIGSIRVRWCGPGLVRPSPEGRENLIYLFWHQRLLAFPCTHRGLQIRALISGHGDGEMLARVAEGLGHKAIRGSTRRGGSRAARELLAEARTGHDFAITPDGPQGPKFVFQKGAVFFASRSGLPVVPAAVSYRRSWSLPTWDGFIVPCPFTRCVVQAGSIIRVPPDLDEAGLETWRIKLEEALNAVTEDTDRRFEDLFRQGMTTADFFRIEPRFPHPSTAGSTASLDSEDPVPGGCSPLHPASGQIQSPNL